jgi:hypothetical protein
VSSGSRRRTFLIGSTYLVVAAAVYGLVILGMFSVFKFIGYAPWIRLTIAAIAFLFAAINIKDYFAFKRGVSLTISDRYKPKLYRDMRGVMAPGQSGMALIAATAAMAAGITVVEMPCTAGLPLLWTKLVSATAIGHAGFLVLLALYLLMFLLDELAVFGAVLITLRASRLDETEGRVMKLIGGVVMLTLAVVLLVNPSLMESVRSTVVVFGAALAASGLVIVVHRWLLPRLGVRIGLDDEPGGGAAD